jgi:aminopeptidase N
MLNGDVAPGRLIDLAIRALPRERDEQTIQRGLAYLQHAYWRFTAARRRLAIAPRVERMLIDAVHLSPVTTLKSSCFATLRGVAVSATTLDWLTAVWHKTQAVPGMPLAERDDIALVRELAVRAVPGWERMVAAQCARTASADRRERLSFMAPALSDDPLTRDRFFASLRERENRRHEPWVLEAVQYLHHPLRAERSTAYIRPSLDLLRDIQRTGDIFFPKRWVDATLSGHQSAAAAGAVQSFLDDLPSDYPDRLRRAVVSSADPLFRAVRIVTPDGS